MAEFEGNQIETVEIDEEAIRTYAKENFSVDEVFSDDEIKEYIKESFGPDDIFSDATLEEWAVENDYIKKEE